MISNNYQYYLLQYGKLTDSIARHEQSRIKRKFIWHENQQ